MEDIQSRHKKEIKALDGERRAAIKKAKALKGKKGKEALQSAETEFDEKLRKLEEKHAKELLDVASNMEETASETQEWMESSLEPATSVPHEQQKKDTKMKDAVLNENDVEDDGGADDGDTNERRKKQEKARRKKEARRERERQRQEELEREMANAGPSMRQIELDAIQGQLQPLSLTVTEIPSDGNCLYRAVAAQCPPPMTFTHIRQLCATVLKDHREEYEPFVEYTDTITTFEEYVERIRSSSDWGGHLELRAISEGLHRPIIIWSALQPKLVLGNDDDNNDNDNNDANDKDTANDNVNPPIMLSYHLHYYSLGEHYNQVIPISKLGGDGE